MERGKAVVMTREMHMKREVHLWVSNSAAMNHLFLRTNTFI